MRKVASCILVVFMCLFAFTGCFGGTIEQRVTKAQLDQMCEEIKSNPLFKSAYSDVKVEVEDNHITYKYYMKDNMDSTQMEAFKINMQDSGLKGQISELKDSFEKQSGIRPDKITYQYYTPNDQLIVTIEE